MVMRRNHDGSPDLNSISQPLLPPLPLEPRFVRASPVSPQRVNYSSALINQAPVNFGGQTPLVLGGGGKGRGGKGGKGNASEPPAPRQRDTGVGAHEQLVAQEAVRRPTGDPTDASELTEDTPAQEGEVAVGRPTGDPTEVADLAENVPAQEEEVAVSGPTGVPTEAVNLAEDAPAQVGEAAVGGPTGVETHMEAGNLIVDPPLALVVDRTAAQTVQTVLDARQELSAAELAMVTRPRPAPPVTSYELSLLLNGIRASIIAAPDQTNLLECLLLHPLSEAMCHLCTSENVTCINFHGMAFLLQRTTLLVSLALSASSRQELLVMLELRFVRFAVPPLH